MELANMGEIGRQAAGDSLTLSRHLNAVVDLSHHNGAVDLGAAKQAGLLGIIHKATQGLGYVDPMFHVNAAKACELGLLLGAYHFGVAAEGAAQADHFLKTTARHPQVLLVLDLETNPAGPSMTLDQARAFVTYVERKTGRWPGLYSGDYIKALLRTEHDPVLANCWFWLAQYDKSPVIPANWSKWTMWQYTNGKDGDAPCEMLGIGLCDRNLFAGDEAALRAFWRGDRSKAL
jgi:lysozyme